MKRILTAAAMGLAMMGSAGAAQDNWPVRPIKLIVPYPPGGPVDNVARLIAPEVSAKLGQSLVIDNRAGASGTIGTDATVRADPDGYTFGFGVPGALTGLPHVMKVPYELKDINYVTLVVRIPQVIMASTSIPEKTLPALIATAKANPGKYNFGSAGNVTTPHLGGELLNQQAGIKLTHIPYKGAAPAVTALMGNEIQVFPGDASAAIGFIKAGRVQALAVSSAKRFEGLPDVPTTAELGLPGVVSDSNYGIIAPKGVPPATIEKFRQAVIAAVNEPEVRKKLIDQGALPVTTTPEEYRRLMDQEFVKWGKVIKDGKLGEAQP
ncbi:tripartite tricarboxylate transporter substrate binding protein [Alcaligenaceae bacterium B3P038]|nr:tripartite tricarboxylate transporter substrate binding protein [Alcaligenaceae bacterium B3P038]